MLKNYAAASALVLALSTPALAQNANDFRMQSMQANAFEVQSSQIALSKSRNPRVRSYAQEVIRDHRAANVALAGGRSGAMAAGDQGLGGLITAPIAVAGSAVGAGVGAATGVVGGTLSGGPVGGLQGAGAGAANGAAMGGQLCRGEMMATGASTIVPPEPRAAGDALRAVRCPGRRALRPAVRDPADPGPSDEHRDDPGLCIRAARTRPCATTPSRLCRRCRCTTTRPSVFRARCKPRPHRDGTGSGRSRRTGGLRERAAFFHGRPIPYRRLVVHGSGARPWTGARSDPVSISRLRTAKLTERPDDARVPSARVRGGET